MKKLKKHIKKKEDLHALFSLYAKQSWLLDKTDNLLELLSLCETAESKKLLIQLLSDFHYLGPKILDGYLSLIADYIVTDSGFPQNTCQIASITYDDEADSSQKVLDYVKMPLYKHGWADFKSVNRYGAIIKNYKQGRKQIIFVDEFVGSGQTILGRIKQLQSDLNGNFDLKCCFIAGMDFGIKKIEEQGYAVFCPLRLPKGISERFKDKELEQSISNMNALEAKLAQNINDHNLSKYSFGYNGAEALYSLNDCQGNTPNSVFPIFWWPRLLDNNPRQTLLTRFERGLR